MRMLYEKGCGSDAANTPTALPANAAENDEARHKAGLRGTAENRVGITER